MKKSPPDYTLDAVALFERFSTRHNLQYEVVDAPVEVCWRFPQQAGLSTEIILGLQNRDELNFGVVDFWSYFWPFPKVATEFEGYIDAWVVGAGRIAVYGGRARVFQIWQRDAWRSVYGANKLLPSWIRPKSFIQNQPLEHERD